ncbi:hypothetical protein [Pseudomonas sp. TSRC2-2]|uniref:hypothetical protein n=1 Tax=unclassified Pseudomonas TaxID=196821 RepID=UPI003CF6B34B
MRTKMALDHLADTVLNAELTERGDIYWKQRERKSKTTKKGPPFGEPFQTAQQSGFCLVGAIGLEPTTPTMSMSA